MTERTRRDRRELEGGVADYVDAIRQAAASSDPEASFCESFACSMDLAKKGDLSARATAWLCYRLARTAERDGADLGDAIKTTAADFA